MPKIITREEARQGETGLRLRYVLGSSLLLAVAALTLTLVAAL